MVWFYSHWMLMAMVPKGDVWYGTDIVVSDFSICSFGTNTGGRTSSSGGGCGSQGTVTGVRAFLIFGECACSDNMGSKRVQCRNFLF